MILILLEWKAWNTNHAFKSNGTRANVSKSLSREKDRSLGKKNTKKRLTPTIKTDLILSNGSLLHSTKRDRDRLHGLRWYCWRNTRRALESAKQGYCIESGTGGQPFFFVLLFSRQAQKSVRPSIHSKALAWRRNVRALQRRKRWVLRRRQKVCKTKVQEDASRKLAFHPTSHSRNLLDRQNFRWKRFGKLVWCVDKRPKICLNESHES